MWIMKTYKKLSATLIVSAVISLLLTVIPVVFFQTEMANWKVLLLVGGPVLVFYLSLRYLTYSENRHSLDDRCESERKQVVGAVYSLCVLLLASEIFTIIRISDAVTADVSHRVFGCAVGAWMIVLGNAMPKVSYSKKTLSLQKLSNKMANVSNWFSGLALVIAGFGWIISWALSPVEIARFIAPSILILAILLSWIRLKLAQRSSPDSDHRAI